MNQRPLFIRLLKPTLNILIGLAVLSSSGTGGCAKLFPEDPLALTIPPEQLQASEPLDLRASAEDKPQTLDQAKEAINKNLEQSETTGEGESGGESGGDSGGEITLSLAEVRAATLEGNLDLQVQLFNPTLSQTSVNAEEAKFESTFSASARRSVFDSPTVVSTAGSSVTSEDLSVGLTIPLRTGGTTTITLPVNRTETNNPFATLNPSVNSDLSFRIQQPLLRGAGPRVNTHSIRIQKYNLRISEAQTKIEAIRVLAGADRAYWNLYAAHRELEVRFQQYKLARELRDKAQRKVDLGAGTRIEVTRAESGMAARIESIIIARTNVRRLQRDLKRIMNRDDLPLDSPTRLVLETEAVPPVGLRLDPRRLADHAIENRMEMLQLELQIAQDASTLDFNRNARLPSVALDFTYNISGLGSTFGNSFNQLGDKNFEDWIFGLNASIPLGNEAAKAGVHRAILQRLQRLATKEQQELAIRQEVYNAVDTLEQNWQRIVAASYASDLAEETYQAELRQFSVGQRTSTDVLDAATELANAQLSEINALTQYRIAEVNIAFATGTLLGANRIQWEPVAMPTE